MMQWVVAKSGGLFAAMLLALFAASQAVDTPFAVHMVIFALAALLATVIVLRNGDVAARCRRPTAPGTTMIRSAGA